MTLDGQHPFGPDRRSPGAHRPPGGMRTCAQILGGVVLGLGLAFALDASPGLIFAGYTVGLGVLLLCLGLLLPDDPDAADGPGPLHDPRPKRR